MVVNNFLNRVQPIDHLKLLKRALTILSNLGFLIVFLQFKPTKNEPIEHIKRSTILSRWHITLYLYLK